MLKEIHAVLPAADIERARSFYHDTLGLEPDEEHPGSLMYHPAQGSTVEISEADAASTVGTSGAPAGSRVQGAGSGRLRPRWITGLPSDLVTGVPSV